MRYTVDRQRPNRSAISATLNLASIRDRSSKHKRCALLKTSIGSVVDCSPTVMADLSQRPMEVTAVLSVVLFWRDRRARQRAKVDFERVFSDGKQS